jgi:hypothetical protein
LTTLFISRLANDDDFLVSDDFYSVRFVKDSVKAKKILDKEKYRYMNDIEMFISKHALLAFQALCLMAGCVS